MCVLQTINDFLISRVLAEFACLLILNAAVTFCMIDHQLVFDRESDSQMSCDYIHVRCGFEPDCTAFSVVFCVIVSCYSA